MTFCSPLRENKKDNWTCLTQDELIEIVKVWNKTSQGKKSLINIKEIYDLQLSEKLWYQLQFYIQEYNKCTSKSTPLPTQDFSIDLNKFIYCLLQNKFKSYCTSNTLDNGEICWIEHSEIQRELSNSNPKFKKILDTLVFKPKGTKTQYGWLNTTHIENVMHQYQQLYKDFKFIDCVPSDHYILYPLLFPKKNIQNYSKSALVFNLDESHQSGSHWVAVFIQHSLINNQHTLVVEYFDSTGNKPIKNIKTFLYHPWFKNFNTIYKINKFKHQKGDSECGVFCLFYIQQRLKGATFEDFQKERLSDQLMKKYRSVFFRPMYHQSSSL